MTFVKDGRYYLFDSTKEKISDYYHLNDVPEYLKDLWQDFNEDIVYLYVNYNLEATELVGINGITYYYKDNVFTEKKIKWLYCADKYGYEIGI